MKVAILFPGMLRNFEITYPYFKKYVMDPLNPDIFFSGYPNKQGLNYCENKIIELWNPKKYIIQEYTQELREKICSYENKLCQRKRSETTPHTWMSGIYNVKQANDLKKQYEFENNFNYDVVIKTRIDMFYYRSYSDLELNRAKNGELLIPEAWDFKEICPLGVSDVCAVSTSKNIDLYSSLYDNIEKYFDEGVYTFHPESYTGIHITRVGLMEKRTPLFAGIDNSGWGVFEHTDTPNIPSDRKHY